MSSSGAPIPDEIEAVGPPRLEEIDQGVFAYIQPDGTWWINNAAFVAASDGIVMVDTCSTERRTRAFLDAVGTVSGQPIRMLINTHHHGDHTNGNYLTHPATIVGHTRCRQALLDAGIQHYDGVFEPIEWGDLRVAPPILTFDDRVDVHVGDIRMELHYVGTPAHTTNDIVVWLPDCNVLVAGDLVFNGSTPFMLMGSVQGSLDALDRLRAFNAERILPGHGPVCDSSVLDTLTAYSEFVVDVAQRADEADVSPLEAARSVDLGSFGELTDSERLVGNLHRALFERRGAERGATLDHSAAIADMVAYNHGRPLRCRA